jgi:Zn-dependent protease
VNFSLAGIPVRVEFSFFIVCAFLGFSRMDDMPALASWIGVVFISILVHEFGHALTALAFQQEVTISLHGMGGTASYTGKPLAGWQRTTVALAGPGAGHVLGGAAILAVPLALMHPLATVVVQDLIWVNVGWGVLNLVPIQPLDGSHALDGMLGRVAQPTRERIVTGVSIASAVVLAGLALLFQMYFALFLLGWVMLDRVFAIRRSRAWAADAPHIEAANAALQANDAEAAIEPLKALAKGARAEGVAAWAQNNLVAVYTSLGRADDAAEWLARVEIPPLQRAIVLLEAGRAEDALTPLFEAMARTPGDASNLLLRALAEVGHDEAMFELLEGPEGVHVTDPGFTAAISATFKAGRFDSAARLAELAFSASGDGRHAFNAACAVSRLGDVDTGLIWMERAAEAGWDDAGSWDTDADISALRADPRWASVRGRVGI